MTDTPASLAALGIEPVAWLYVHEFSTGTRHSVVCPQSERMESPESRGWTETPLYSLDDLAPLIAKARRVEALEAENARLRGALIDHNDQLRSAAQVAGRDGRDTNWLSFRGSLHYTLAEHHELTNEARAALKENTDATSGGSNADRDGCIAAIHEWEDDNA